MQKYFFEWYFVNFMCNNFTLMCNIFTLVWSMIVKGVGETCFTA